jgi:hypothetical protein
LRRYKKTLTSKQCFMQKMYSETSHLERVNEKLAPREETIRFLLDYSKALSVIDYNKLKFEALLN